MSDLSDAFRVNQSETFAHNLGAKSMRAALILFIIALIALPFKLFKVGSTISYIDKAEVIITDMTQQKHVKYRRRRHHSRRRVTYYTYSITFKGKFADGTSFEGRQNSDAATFRSLNSLNDKKAHSFYVYKSDEKGKLYISQKTHDGAQKEYQKSNHSTPETFGELIFKICGCLCFVAFANGMQHLRAGRRESFSNANNANAAANQRLNDAAKIFDRK